MRRLTSKKTYTIVFLIVLFLLSISFYSNKDFYKQYIIDKIYSTIDFQIVFEDSNFLVFPSPGIILNRVSINNPDTENSYTAQLDSMEFFFSWKILFGEIELNNIYFKNGKIELTITTENPSKTSLPKTSLPKTSLPKTSLPKTSLPKTFDIKNIQKVFTFLNLDTLSLYSIQFVYKKDTIIQDEFYLKTLTITSNHIDLISLDFDMSYHAGNFKTETKFHYTNNNYSFLSLEIESKWKVKNFALAPFKEYYRLVNGANFDNTSIEGELILYKEKFSNKYIIKTEIDIQNLNFIGAAIYPFITTGSEFTYSHESKQIKFQNIRIYYENGAIASANGSLSFTNDVILNLNIKGEYADIYKVVYLLVRSADFNTNSNINFYSRLNIFCAKATFDLYELKNIHLELDIQNTKIDLKIKNADVVHGHISGKGQVIAGQNSTYSFDISLKDINSEELIGKYTINPYLKGTLNSNLFFYSSGNSLNLFLDNLISNGKIEIKKGELLGYANILKPVFSLGKLINILGPRGKNTEFQSLLLDYTLQKKNINVKNLKMIGVGIDAHGGGTITFERKIDFRIYAGLGGLVGKALYIPILYKGVIPDNVSYIDPVWIGSIYVGATLFGGPAGATVGGFAGSAVSEYVNNAWEGIKGLFSREAKEEQ